MTFQVLLLIDINEWDFGLGKVYSYLVSRHWFSLDTKGLPGEIFRVPIEDYC